MIPKEDLAELRRLFLAVKETSAQAQAALAAFEAKQLAVSFALDVVPGQLNIATGKIEEPKK